MFSGIESIGRYPSQIVATGGQVRPVAIADRSMLETRSRASRGNYRTSSQLFEMTSVNVTEAGEQFAADGLLSPASMP